jgi:hypothetical protein
MGKAAAAPRGAKNNWIKELQKNKQRKDPLAYAMPVAAEPKAKDKAAEPAKPVAAKPK